MEFLFLLTVGLVSAYKWSIKRFGVIATKWSIYLGVAIISFIWTYLTSQNIISQEFIKTFLTYCISAIGTYEVIIKWLVKEVIGEGLFNINKE